MKHKATDKTMRNINPFCIQKALDGIALKVETIKIREWYSGRDVY
jgi:hypothetical protein